MRHYAAAATPLCRCFTATADESVFNHLPAQVDLDEKNTTVNKLSEKSAALNFSKEDAIDDAEFNEVLWKGIKGINSVMPSPKRAAFLSMRKNIDEEDDPAKF